MTSAYRRSRVLAIALSTVVVFAAFALGSAHAGTAAVTEIGVWLVAGAWFVLRQSDAGARQRGKLPPALTGSAALLLLYLGAQLVPMPPTLLGGVSPSTADLYRRTIDSLPPPPERVKPIAAVGAADRQAVSVEDRERIRDLAQATQEPSAWRPIALYPFAAQSEWLRYLAYGLALWIAASISAPRVLLAGMVTAGIAVAGVGLVQRATWNGLLLWTFDRLEGPPLLDETRVLGPFVNPNHFAAFVAMALFPAWALAQGDLTSARREDSTGKVATGVAFAIGCAVIVAGLVGSASRGALVGTLMGASILTVVAVRKKWREPAVDREIAAPRRSLAWLMRAAPATLGIVVLGAGFLFAGAANRAALDRRLVSATGSLDFRLDLWTQSLGMLRDFPIVGVGAGCWREAFLRYERYPLTWLRPNHAHNDYLEWACEVGVVGLVLTALLVAAYARHAASNRSIPERLRWPIVASVVVMAVHSAGDFSLRAASNALALSVLLGLLCNRRWRSSRRQEDVATAAPIVGRTFFAVAVGVAALALASGRNLRESLQWSRIHEGSAALHFAPAEASSWEDVGVALYQGGFRYHPPTAEAFRASIARRPTAERSYWLLSLASPRLEDRRHAVEAALALHPSAAVWRIEYAKILERSGQTDAALAELERAAYLDPRIDAHPYLRAGRVTLAKPVAHAVERGFLRAAAARPDDSSLRIGIAGFYEAVRDDEAAGRAWREAAGATGDWIQYSVRAAEAYLRRGDQESANQVLRELIVKAPRFEGGYERLAIDVLLPAKRFDEAVDVLASGVSSGADVASLEVARSAVEIARADELSARAALARAEASGRWNPETQYRIGKQYLALLDMEQASRAFERAVELEPDVAWYAFMLGEARERMYDLEKALESYRRAAALNPADATVRRRIERIEQLASASELTNGRPRSD